MATTSAIQTLPNRDELASEVLPLLGDGGTSDHARAAVDWAIARFLPLIVETSVGRLAGMCEVIEMTGQTRAQILRWSNGQGRTDFPDPVLSLRCGKHWDRRAIERFMATPVTPQDQLTDGARRLLADLPQDQPSSVTGKNS